MGYDWAGVSPVEDEEWGGFCAWSRSGMIRLQPDHCCRTPKVSTVSAGTTMAHALEGAGFMAQLAETNDAHVLRDYCLAHRAVQNGGVACEMPRVRVRAPAK